MLRSMFSGVSGLRSHQIMMDVVSNNIANVNTSGFKASRATFQEAISQVLRGASGIEPPRAGVNPMQIGLGVQAASIDTIFTQGATQLTGRATDVAIDGAGFLIMNVAGQERYTRSGTLNLDQVGNLSGPTGGILQGWMVDPLTGAVDFNAPLEDLSVPAGQTIDPVPTSVIEYGGSLPAEALVGDSIRATISVFDTLGNPHEVIADFVKTGVNAWEVTVTLPAGATAVSGLGPTAMTFDTDGNLTSAPTILLDDVVFPGGAGAQDITLDLAGQVPVVQFGGVATLNALGADGNAKGTLSGIEIGADGAITGRFSNGKNKILAYIALATFTNPGGLGREGESFFAESANSGVPLIGRPSGPLHGPLVAGAVEASNVDLAQEFTNMIIAQRGFQANSRAITTSDELLNELINLKR